MTMYNVSSQVLFPVDAEGGGKKSEKDKFWAQM